MTQSLFNSISPHGFMSRQEMQAVTEAPDFPHILSLLNQCIAHMETLAKQTPETLKSAQLSPNDQFELLLYRIKDTLQLVQAIQQEQLGVISNIEALAPDQQTLVPKPPLENFNYLRHLSITFDNPVQKKEESSPTLYFRKTDYYLFPDELSQDYLLSNFFADPTYLDKKILTDTIASLSKLCNDQQICEDLHLLPIKKPIKEIMEFLDSEPVKDLADLKPNNTLFMN